jgi:hypothetical protein
VKPSHDLSGEGQKTLALAMHCDQEGTPDNVNGAMATVPGTPTQMVNSPAGKQRKPASECCMGPRFQAENLTQSQTVERRRWGKRRVLVWNHKHGHLPHVWRAKLLRWSRRLYLKALRPRVRTTLMSPDVIMLAQNSESSAERTSGSRSTRTLSCFWRRREVVASEVPPK